MNSRAEGLRVHFNQAHLRSGCHSSQRSSSIVRNVNRGCCGVGIANTLVPELFKEHPLKLRGKRIHRNGQGELKPVWDEEQRRTNLSK